MGPPQFQPVSEHLARYPGTRSKYLLNVSARDEESSQIAASAGQRLFPQHEESSFQSTWRYVLLQ